LYRKILTFTVLLYLVAVSFLWILINLAGDRWWFATIIIFSPRWLLSLPLVLLMPLALWKQRMLLIPLILVALVIFGPLMRFNLPLGKQDRQSYPETKALRVVTCNLDSADYDTSVLVTIIRNLSADVVALQECPEEIKLTLPAGWQMIKERGLAIASRYPLERVASVKITPPGEEWPGTYLLHAAVHVPGRDIAFCSIHLPTPRFGLMKVLDRYTVFRPSRRGLLEEETALRRMIALETHSYISRLKQPVIVAGDFNTPVDSILYKRIWTDYTNAFSEVGFGYGWTQRATVRGFTYSARIDHILSGNGLTPRLSEVGKEIGSDHLPLIADIAY